MAVNSTSRFKSPLSIWSLISAGLLFYALFGLQKSYGTGTFDSHSAIRRDLKTADVSAVYAMVFYGRRQTTSILVPYLRHNLRKNGGMLDFVEFFANTKDEEDLDYLESLLHLEPDFRLRPPTVEDSVAREGYKWMWKDLHPNAIFFKLDDDIVYIRDGTFEAMVAELLRGKYPVVSANIVNHPWLSLVHARLGLIKTYDFFAVNSRPNPTDWRLPSVQPHLTSRHRINSTAFDELVQQEGRFVAAQEDPTANFRLPAHDWSWAWFDPEWPLSAHYSYLSHLEKGDENKYDMGIWDLSLTGYEHYSINTFCSHTDYFTKNLPLPIPSESDEIYISEKMPELTGQHHVAVGAAVVSHYSYGLTLDFMEKTDVRQRYRLLAEETFGIHIEDFTSSHL